MYVNLDVVDMSSAYPTIAYTPRLMRITGAIKTDPLLDITRKNFTFNIQNIHIFTEYTVYVITYILVFNR